MLRIDPLGLLLALILDLCIGDPERWPHIARFTGTLSVWFEKRLTSKGEESRTVVLGFVFWLLVVGTIMAGYCAINFVLSLIPLRFGVLNLAWAFNVFVIYQSIAAKDLVKHAKAVLGSLQEGDLPWARWHLSRMVGRDTENLEAAEISRATIESVAESINDGIIAPLFFALIAGAPGALLYRVANTLDSLVGHRTESYEKFGKASALIDDILNLIPARIAAFIFCKVNQNAKWDIVKVEAATHSSPNAGFGEVAMAYGLGVRLGGDNTYGGVVVPMPVFNAEGREAAPEDIASSLDWMWKVTGCGAGIFLLISMILYYIGL